MGQYYKPTILGGENKRVVFAWMYSHDIKNTYKRDDGTTFKVGTGIKLMEHSWMKNDFVNTFEALIAKKPQNVVWAGDYAEPEPGSKKNVYARCADSTKVIPKDKITDAFRYVVNHTKKLYVDKKAVSSKKGWKIHPLPLLTCEGNGQGGGDFYGEDPFEIVGTWARDLISVETKIPTGYAELKFTLVE